MAAFNCLGSPRYVDSGGSGRATRFLWTSDVRSQGNGARSRVAEEGGGLRDFEKESGRRNYLPSLAGQEEARRTPTMPRSEVRQQMFALHKVQDGKSSKCSSNGAARRFYDFNRSKRWLSAYTNSQGVSKSTTIQTQEQVLSVQLAPLRIVDGSEAVYQGPPPCGLVGQAARYQNYGVLRRFSYPRKLLRPGGTAFSSGHRVIGEAGVKVKELYLASS